MNFEPNAGTTRLLAPGDIPPPSELLERYDSLLSSREAQWMVDYELIEKIGEGSQGTVFLANRRGNHGFRCRVALKFYSPSSYDQKLYREHMCYVAEVATHLASMQQDHLLDVQNVVEVNGIQVMVMEWVDGFDLRRLLGTETMLRLRDRVDEERFEYVNDVVVTEGPNKLRLKPGVSIAILRECLAGLAALHREGIVHGDVKPANIMIKRTGNTKLVDFGSAFLLNARPAFRTWTPMYAAPEMLEQGICNHQSDLASIGYVLIEMLSGIQLFPENSTRQELLYRKRQLPGKLKELLPSDIAENTLLINLLLGLIAIDPKDRFESAEAAELTEEGAAEFQRQLVKGDLSSEYETEIRHWLDEVA